MSGISYGILRVDKMIFKGMARLTMETGFAGFHLSMMPD